MLAEDDVGLREPVDEAVDEQERVGEGTHERFVVDMGRFMERIAAKHAPRP